MCLKLALVVVLYYHSLYIFYTVMTPSMNGGSIMITIGMHTLSKKQIGFK